ncbi:MAG TPA: lantibiotic dehydratase [Herpetosiphonaceae bacterium]
MDIPEQATRDMERPQAAEDGALPDHLAELSAGRWAIWRWAGLRGAGFPAAQVLSLAATDGAEAADRLIQARDDLEQAREAAREALRQELQSAPQDQVDPLVGALRRLKKGKLPDPGSVSGAASTALLALGTAHEHLEAAQAAYDLAFPEAVRAISLAVRSVAQSARFQEALIWQNRQAFHTGVEPLLRAPAEKRGSQQRQHEEVIASYVQRYCTKNDTIGFFGPAGWARFVDQGPAVTARPGPELIANRSVYFEGWCLDTLAKKLSEHKALLPWSAPRRMPSIYAEGDKLYLPFEGVAQLTPAQTMALQACDGQRTAREIAQQLTRAPASGLTSEAEVYNLLKALRDRGLIAWAFELPLELRPERTLQRLLTRIGDESLRRQALGVLEQLDAARGRVARAAGDPVALDRALDNLETTFTRITGTAATRAAGKMYAARTLVYEDCRRDLDLELGPDLLKTLGPPLALLLTGARWFTFQVAQRFRTAFQEIYAELVRETGSSAVDLVEFWLRVQPILLFGDHSPLIADVTRQFQERWAEILALPAGQRSVVYSCDELRERVQAAFAAPGAGWRSARYHSPDVLIAAASIDAIRQGAYHLVMGEMHLGINTLGAAFFMAQHPEPAQLHMALERDLAEPSLVPVTPRNVERLTTRTRPALVSSKDYRLVFAHDSAGISQARALPMGALLVEDPGDGIRLRTRDGRLHFDIIEAFSLMLSVMAVNNFRLVAPEAHQPRISVDRLVVSREAWRFDPAEMAFANERSEAERFVAARRWAQTHGIPRFVFAKLPIEVKPFYVDFDSPIYVNMFAKLIRRMQASDSPERLVTVTEMLPGLDQTWLPDAEQRCYTSEIRIVGVDLNP